MKHTIPALLALASGMLLVPTLEAQTGPPEGRRGQVLDRFDENGDGQLDREEFQKLRAFMAESGPARGLDRRRAQRRADDGSRPAPPKGPGQKLKRRPPGQPGPGPGGRERPRPDRKALIKKFDADGDGRLDREERAKLRSELEARRDARPDGRQRRGPGPQGRRPPGRGPDQGRNRPASGCSCPCCTPSDV